MTTTTPDQPTPDETLALEAQGRSRAAFGAWAAGVLTLLGSIVAGVAQSGNPTADDKVVTVLDALGKLSRGEEIPPGRAAAQVEWLGDHAAALVAGAALTAIGTLLIFVPLSYLYRATKARHPSLPKAVVILGAIGVACFAMGSAASAIGFALGARDFAGGDNSEAVDAIYPPAFQVGQLLRLTGGFALGFSFVMLGMNAMRVGLLTRFMGVLGVIVGATFVIQQIDQQGIIRSFWLGALGFLIIGRWPNGVPPAWETGRAQPWPSAAQTRMRGSDPLPETPAPVPPPSDGLSQGQRRKKRKKR